MNLEILTEAGGSVSLGDTVRLEIPTVARGYANAQVDDYHMLPRRRFRHRPPLELSLHARASRPAPIGTLGFGFWNDPFGVSIGAGGRRLQLPAMPQALWFFYGSPPNALPMASVKPAAGWFASSLRSLRWPPLLLALPAAAGLALSRVSITRKWAVELIRRQIAVDGARLSVALDEWHYYQLRWLADRAEFRVDGELVHVSKSLAAAPLGFVAWIDNQYASLTAESGLRFGVLPTPSPQALELRQLRID